MSIIILKSILAVCLTTVVLSSCGNKQDNQQASQRPPATFPVAQITQKTVTGYKNIQQILKVLLTVMLEPKVSGYIQKVFVDEGQKVSKGQTFLN